MGSLRRPRSLLSPAALLALLALVFPVVRGQTTQLAYSNIQAWDNRGIRRDLHPAGDSIRTFTPLNLTAATQSANNLGGLGPYNGMIYYLAPVLYGDDCASAGRSGVASPVDRNCRKDPNFVNFVNVGMQNGRRISMRIDNSSVYEPANPTVNYFNGDPFQLNLRPLYDPSAGQHPTGHVSQPFELASAAELGTLLGSAVLGNIAHGLITNLVNVLGMNLRSENSNAVNLFFQFYDEDTGSPIELEEVRACVRRAPRRAREKGRRRRAQRRTPSRAPSRFPRDRSKSRSWARRFAQC